MTEETAKVSPLGSLRAEIQGPIKLLLDWLKADLGENMESVSVIGSGLTDDFDSKSSDINTVLVVRRRSHELLKVLAAKGRTMGKHKLRAPLLMTKEYIDQSLDVFGMEFLDFQHNHVTVYGEDPFASLVFRHEDVRLQCERELKAALIKLRQGYIRSLGKAKMVSQLLLDCVSELIVIWRTLLWLTDQERPKGVMAGLEKAAARFEFDAEKIRPLVEMRLRHRHGGCDDVEGAFESLYQVIDHLARKVDRLGKGS